ncbi:MAG: hypothetical protein IPG54_03600 [Sphingomonadales bacterium]|nr:hypothetical protein [Sphingomonadales bacterium]
MMRTKSGGSKIGLALAGVAVIGTIALFAPKLLLGKAVINDIASDRSAPMPNSDGASETETLIDLAGRSVPVIRGGLYDRFRSNPPLSVIEQERPDLDLSWFKTLSKERKDVGFVTYSPNFYYSNSSITAIYTADMDAIEALIPAPVKGVVQPISYAPGKRALPFFFLFRAQLEQAKKGAAMLRIEPAIQIHTSRTGECRISATFRGCY